MMNGSLVLDSGRVCEGIEMLIVIEGLAFSGMVDLEKVSWGCGNIDFDIYSKLGNKFLLDR